MVSSAATVNGAYNTANYTLGNITKSALAFSANSGGEEGFATDGNLILDVIAAIPATQNRLTIGHTRNISADLDGYLQRVWYMPTRQPDGALTDYSR